MKALAFLLYDSRSGSTLLSALLNSYRGVSVSIETDIVYRVLEYPKALHSREEFRRFLDFLDKKARFSELHIDRQMLCDYLSCFNSCLSKNNILNGILELYFKLTDPQAECWIIKGQRIYYHIQTLLQFYPDAKFIHIIRDGRAVYNSKKNTPSIQHQNGIYINRGVMDNNLLHAAYSWHKKLAIADRFKEHVFNLRYEDLIQNPDATLKQTLDYLIISQENRLQTKCQKTFVNRMEAAYHTIHPKVFSPIQTGNIDKWKKSLKPEQVYIYEKINRYYLECFKYEITEFNNKHNLAFHANVLFYLNYYWFNWLIEKANTVIRTIFVTRNFMDRICSKLREFRGKKSHKYIP